MDRGAQPWRALEEPADAARHDAADGPGGVGGGSVPADGRAGARQWLVAAAGIGAAVLLAVVAVIVAWAQPTELTLAGIETGAAVGATEQATPDAPMVRAQALLAVDVGGAVGRPGVYRLPSGSRVADAIAAAGGYGPRVDVRAASDQLNLAAVVADGDRIRVPERGDGSAAVPDATSAVATSRTGPAATPARPVDLNRATATELEALPGIGPVTAAKIIAARTTEPFAAVDDLRSRGLVGPATFAKIQALVTVGP